MKIFFAMFSLRFLIFFSLFNSILFLQWKHAKLSVWNWFIFLFFFFFFLCVWLSSIFQRLPACWALFFIFPFGTTVLLTVRWLCRMCAGSTSLWMCAHGTVYIRGKQCVCCFYLACVHVHCTNCTRIISFAHTQRQQILWLVYYCCKGNIARTNICFSANVKSALMIFSVIYFKHLTMRSFFLLKYKRRF